MTPLSQDDLSLVTADDPVLRCKATLVQRITGVHRRTGQQMLNLLRESATGVGLAANQVGITKRIIAVRWGDDELVLVNPKLDQFSEVRAVDNEGCLTLPGVSVAVTRPVSCRVRGRHIEGHEISRVVSGMLARILQHEVDHLDGILITDYERHMTTQ